MKPKSDQEEKDKRHEEFRKIVYEHELSSRRIAEITGRNEAYVALWRMEKSDRVIPKRQLEKIKQALGIPIEE